MPDAVDYDNDDDNAIFSEEDARLFLPSSKQQHQAGVTRFEDLDEDPWQLNSRTRAEVPRIVVPHKPRATPRRPYSAGTFRPGSQLKRKQRPSSAHLNRAASRGLADHSFAQFMLGRIQDADDARQVAESNELRSKLLAFAHTERVYADKDRVLRQLDVHRRNLRMRAESADAENDIQLTRAAASVVNKVRSFYSDLRAERVCLQKVTDGLKDQMRESILEKERALAAAAAAEAAREAALTELDDTKREAKAAMENANTTMSAAAQASASACTDAARLKIELESMRHELRNARNAEDEARRSKLADVDQMRARVEEEASRSRELAIFGERMKSKVTSVEHQAQTVKFRAEVAEERAARLEAVTSINTALSAEVERLKSMLMCRGGKAPARHTKTRRSPTKGSKHHKKGGSSRKKSSKRVRPKSPRR